MERLIRTINERLRANQRIVLDKDNTGLSEMLYALRTAPKENKISPAELHTSRKFTTVKDIITTKPIQHNYNVSDNDNNFELTMSDFTADQDSEILVRERTRGSKLETAYKKKKGQIIAETPHTITMKERGRSLPTLFSKREVATSHKMATPQLNKQNTNDQSANATINKPTKTLQPKPQTRPTNTTAPIKPKKKHSKRIPTEFKRLENWREVFFESKDEEEDERRQKSKASTSAIKATVNWTKTEPEEPTEHEKQFSEQETDTADEPGTSTGEKRPQRNQKAPHYYGDAVMICGLEKPEIINISSSEDSLR